MEWHFADGSELEKFRCAKCPEFTQKARRCHTESWSNPPDRVFPLKLTEWTGIGHDFCPAKLWRDDPATATYAQELFLSWRLGQMPEGVAPDTMTEDHASDLINLIVYWERLTQAAQFKRLARLLGADGGTSPTALGTRPR